MKKPRTQAQLDRATDQRLQKTYNITLKDYERMLKEQSGGCGVCSRAEGTRRLHVDHDHAWKKVSIEAHKNPGEWEVVATYLNKKFYGHGIKKSSAVRAVKRQLLRASVRGLLCYQHNAGLQKFSDNPDWLRNAADYLDKHREGK